MITELIQEKNPSLHSFIFVLNLVHLGSNLEAETLLKERVELYL